MDTKKQFALTIRRLRTYCDPKLTQQDVADEAGISRRQYIKLENGESMPNLETLIKLANAFDKKLSDFCKDIENTIE